MANCHEAYRRQQLADADKERSTTDDSWAQPTRTLPPEDLMAVPYEQYLAYPTLLPEAWLESTLKLHREAEMLATATSAASASAPPPPQGRRMSGKARRKSAGPAEVPPRRFSYTPSGDGLERQKWRHAVIIALDRYADDHLQDTTHCVHDARVLGRVLEALHYSVELVVNDMDQGRQPTKKLIVDTLTCASDRGVDTLLVVFLGYWVTAPLHIPGRPGAQLTQFALCYDTPVDAGHPTHAFKFANVLTLDEVKSVAMSPALDWETVLLVDGLQPGYVQGCRGEGYTIICSSCTQDVCCPSQMRYQSLLAFYLEKGLCGAAQADGEAKITLSSLHSYLGQKISKHTYGGIPSLGEEADALVLAHQILHSGHSAEPHPRHYLQSRPVKFLVDCAFGDDVHPDDFQTALVEAIRAADKGQQVHRLQVSGVRPCKTMEFLLKCPVAETRSPQALLKLKQDIDKFADETPWVQMRTAEGEGAGEGAQGSSLRWALTVGMGLDHNSPATLLTIYTGSPESLHKTREKFASRRLKEWAGFPIVWMRQRVQVECRGTEYDCKKLDIIGRVGTLCNDDPRGQRPDPRPPNVYVYGVQVDKEAVWRPRPLPLRRFNLLSERQFHKLREGLPMLVFWCGKAENPNATITPGQEMVHNALRGICSEVDFNNKLRFFMYETDVVVYPPYVVDCLAKFRPKRPEDEVMIVYLKYDRAVTLDVNCANVRVSAERLRAFCNDFLQGRAQRLHDGTMRALRPADLPAEHPGVVVAGINHFDRLVLNYEDDVLVLYWNPDCLEHQRAKLERAVYSMARLGRLFSEQPEDVRHPKLVIMSDDNNERFFFPEHHPDATVSIAPGQDLQFQEVHDPGAKAATPRSRAGSPRPEVPKPAYTIRVFPANEKATDKVARGEFLDYWSEVFEVTVRDCKTFYAAANSPVALCDFLEKNTDWAPRVPLRVAMGQDIKDGTERDEKLPDIFQGL